MRVLVKRQRPTSIDVGLTVEPMRVLVKRQSVRADCKFASRAYARVGKNHSANLQNDLSRRFYVSVDSSSF